MVGSSCPFKQVAKRRQFIGVGRHCCLEVWRHAKRPSGGVDHALEVDAGMDAGQRELLRDWLGRENSHIGDDGHRAFSRQPQALPAVSTLEMSG